MLHNAYGPLSPNVMIDYGTLQSCLYDATADLQDSACLQQQRPCSGL